VINQAHGTYTTLPTLGQVIRQGHPLYRVNDRPVVLLYGSTPAYRTLSAGASGPDVAELNADLVALGYATSTQLRSSSAVLGSATTTAVKKLQAALGVPPTGTLSLGQAVFEPVAVRVTSVPVQPGGSAQPGETVLQGTSTTREVQMALDASQQTSMAVGNKVSMALPDITRPLRVSFPRWGRSQPAPRARGQAARGRAPPPRERTHAPQAALRAAPRRSRWT
jgi:peptidoglycan hydrolase-like protein with peptidoglycan-binding domain